MIDADKLIPLHQVWWRLRVCAYDYDAHCPLLYEDGIINSSYEVIKKQIPTESIINVNITAS